MLDTCLLHLRGYLLGYVQMNIDPRDVPLHVRIDHHPAQREWSVRPFWGCDNGMHFRQKDGHGFLGVLFAVHDVASRHSAGYILTITSLVLGSPKLRFVYYPDSPARAHCETPGCQRNYPHTSPGQCTGPKSP